MKGEKTMKGTMKKTGETKTVLMSRMGMMALMFMAAICMCFFKTENVNAAAKMTVEQLQQKFPSGKYWNHAGNPGNSNVVNNQDGYTSSPCSKHGVVGTSKQTCNGFAPNGSQVSWQCMGYAEKLGYDFTGYNPRNNSNGWHTSYSVSSLNSLKAGDIVRYKNNGHSIFVTAINGDMVTYTDCNSDGHCKILWNRTVSKSKLKSTFTYTRSAPFVLSTGNNTTGNTKTDNNATGNGYSAPDSVSMPSITNVAIDTISSKHITFHFTANNAALAKVVIESRNTGKSVSYSYTSGLNNISQYFYAGTLPGTTEMNVRIYAYSTVNGGNEVLHNVLYGDTPDVVKLPQEYAAMEDVCFDPAFYAAVNTDVRTVYGTDEAKLYYHWISYGIMEGRNASVAFDVKHYLNVNSDIRQAVGSDYKKAYEHFIRFGSTEYRNSSMYYDGQYYKNKYYGEFKDMDSRQLLRHFRDYGLREGRYASDIKYTGSSSWK